MRLTLRRHEDATPAAAHKESPYHWAEGEPDASEESAEREARRRMLITTLAMFFQRGWGGR